jgi:hypothetical protein
VRWRARAAGVVWHRAMQGLCWCTDDTRHTPHHTRSLNTCLRELVLCSSALAARQLQRVLLLRHLGSQLLLGGLSLSQLLTRCCHLRLHLLARLLQLH